jgi:hypothetical protein
MKVSSAILALVLTFGGSTAAWAQDWDLTPEVSSQVAQAAPPEQAAVQPQVSPVPSVNSGFQFDMLSLNNNFGTEGNTTQPYVATTSRATGNQSLATLPKCTTAQFGYVNGGPGFLPSTSLDSFVANAGGNAETIYGDEGAKLSDFDTINRGIQGQTAAGLTTGHQDSSLPSAWN